jgi:hypothetical protein
MKADQGDEPPLWSALIRVFQSGEIRGPFCESGGLDTSNSHAIVPPSDDLGASVMRTKWLRDVGLAAAFGGAIGCTTPKGPNLLTPVPEQYNVPPVEDARYTDPVSYPKDVLNQEPIKSASAGKLPSQQGSGPITATGGAGMGRGATPGGF